MLQKWRGINQKQSGAKKQHQDPHCTEIILLWVLVLAQKKTASSTSLHILLHTSNAKYERLRKTRFNFSSDISFLVFFGISLCFCEFSFYLLAFLVFSFHVLCVCFIFCLSAWCIRGRGQQPPSRHFHIASFAPFNQQSTLDTHLSPHRHLFPVFSSNISGVPS